MNNNDSVKAAGAKPAQLFGDGDTSFKAAGGLAGIRALVDAFYQMMDSAPEAAALRAMHADDLGPSRQRLSAFLCGWLGGPRLYREHFGEINIPSAHRHLAVGAEMRDAWLWCMEQALDRQPYSREFKYYLMQQLHIPAERIRQRCQLSTSGG